MRNTVVRTTGVLVVAGLLVLAGCALDPMEKLSEDIDSQDVAVRKEAVLKLANLRDDRAIDALGDVLESDEEIFDMAGVALVKQGRETVTEKKPDTVITRMANIMNNVHTPLGNRARAAWVLGEIGDREAIPALRGATTAKNAAGEDAVPVQDAAKLALKKLGNESDGAPFELPMGIFKGGPVQVLPEVAKIEVPPEEGKEEKPGEGEKAAKGSQATPPAGLGASKSGSSAPATKAGQQKATQKT